MLHWGLNQGLSFEGDMVMRPIANNLLTYAIQCSVSCNVLNVLQDKVDSLTYRVQCGF